MKLRSHVLVLAVGTLFPMIVFAVVAAAVFAQRERATFQRGATERTLALITAVDSALKTSIVALEALAALRPLDARHLRAFHEEAERVLANRPDWLTIN